MRFGNFEITIDRNRQKGVYSTDRVVEGLITKAEKLLTSLEGQEHLRAEPNINMARVYLTASIMQLGKVSMRDVK